MNKEQKTKAAKPAKMPKIIRPVVMRLTQEEAAKLRYQRMFDKAYALANASEGSNVNARETIR